MKDDLPERSLNLPLCELLDLELHLMATQPGVQLEAFVTGLIRRWLAIDKERLALSRNGQPVRGYQWKSVFLPEGTRLRSSYRRNNAFATVVGDHIRSDEGTALSPSDFVNRSATGRNAWRFVWLRFPGQEQWIRADDCRARMLAQSKT